MWTWNHYLVLLKWQTHTYLPSLAETNTNNNNKNLIQMDSLGAAFCFNTYISDSPCLFVFVFLSIVYLGSCLFASVPVTYFVFSYPSVPAYNIQH